MRRLVLFSGMLMLLIASCQHRTKVPEVIGEKVVAEIDTTPKATAICWVDKGELQRNGRPSVPIRTAKAYVDIQPYRKIKLISFVKKQPDEIKSYLKRRLEIFRVPKALLDSGYVSLGEQYVQLRYLPELVLKAD